MSSQDDPDPFSVDVGRATQAAASGSEPAMDSFYSMHGRRMTQWRRQGVPEGSCRFDRRPRTAQDGAAAWARARAAPWGDLVRLGPHGRQLLGQTFAFTITP